MNDVLDLSEIARVFAAEFLVDFKPGAAAERAGITPQHGSALLRDPRVQALIQEGKRRSALRLAISADATLNKLRMIADASIVPVIEAMLGFGEFNKEFDANEQRLFIICLKELPDDIQYAIKSIKWTKTGPEIIMHDKVAALTLIGRHFNLFSDTVVHTGPGGGPLQMIARTMTPKEAADAYQATLEAGSEA